MAIIKTNVEIIKNTYSLLSDYLKKDIEAREAKLFYKDNKVYKIYNSLYLNKEVLEILGNNHFPYSRNIEDILIQNNQIVGSTTVVDKNWQSFKEKLDNLQMDFYEKKQIIKLLEQMIRLYYQYNLIYDDIDVYNIGISNHELVVGDLDGAVYKNISLEKLLNKGCLIKFYFSLILESNLYELNNCIDFNEFQKNYLIPTFGNINDWVFNMSNIQYDLIRERYQNYILKK